MPLVSSPRNCGSSAVLAQARADSHAPAGKSARCPVAAARSQQGEYAVLAPRPGGEFAANIRGAPVRGRYLELDPPHRLVLSWGYAGPEELPPGASTVEVRLVRDGTGTRVHLEHRDLPVPEGHRYTEGWPHYLARLTAASLGRAAPRTRPACSRRDGSS